MRFREPHRLEQPVHSSFGVLSLQSLRGLGTRDQTAASGAGPSGDALLLEDGSSFLLLEDGVSFLLLES